MLLELHMKNVALVDELNVVFDNGLNILTGETGAGKSVIVGAIMQILGERADTRTIREGSKSALIEGSFDCADLSQVIETVEQNGIYLDDERVLVLRREISQDGRNKCYINGHLTTLSFIKEIGDILVDIHSQNDHQSLLKKGSHLDFLDRFGGIWPEREKVLGLYLEMRKLEDELEGLNQSEQENERMREMYEFYLREIDSAELKPGEEDELRNRKRVLANAEKLHELLTTLYDELKGGENSAISLIQFASRNLSEASKIDTRLKEPLKLIEEGLVSIEEAAISARESTDSIEFNASELEAIEGRLELIFSLKRKYGNTVEEIIKYRDEVEKKLRRIENSDEEANRLRKKIDELNGKLKVASDSLSKKRKKHSSSLSRSVQKELQQLGMQHGKFSVRIEKQEMSPKGADDVEFLISPNLGEKLKPLREIASSGEISRIMLAIKTVLGENDSTPVLIFDEIDVNIGGKTAVTVGEKLSHLGGRHQVICITHLPQVARFADAHFRVRKEAKDRRTLTYVEKLDKKERVEELARMLGSSHDEKDSTRLAKTMINNKGED